MNRQNSVPPVAKKGKRKMNITNLKIELSHKLNMFGFTFDDIDYLLVKDFRNGIVTDQLDDLEKLTYDKYAETKTYHGTVLMKNGKWFTFYKPKERGTHLQHWRYNEAPTRKVLEERKGLFELLIAMGKTMGKSDGD